jgi:hypothetical protein
MDFNFSIHQNITLGKSLTGIHYDLETDYFYGTSDQFSGFIVYRVVNETEFINISSVSIQKPTFNYFRSIITFNGNIYIGTSAGHMLIYSIRTYNLLKNITDNCGSNGESKIDCFSFDNSLNMYYACESRKKMMIKSQDGSILQYPIQSSEYFTLAYLDSKNRIWLTGRKIKVFKQSD